MCRGDLVNSLRKAAGNEAVTEDDYLHAGLTKSQRGETKECLLRGDGSPIISFAPPVQVQHEVDWDFS